MKETINVNGQQFLMNYDRPLSSEERYSVVNQIAQQIRMQHAEIQSLASSLTVTYPTSGQVFVKGTTYNITWTTTGTVKPGVKIELYKGGSFLRQLIYETPTGSPWAWQVPTDIVDASDYAIKITGCELVVATCVAFPTGTSPQFQVITSAAPPCPAGTLAIGNVLQLKNIPTGGQAPYTVTFKRNNVPMTGGTFTGVLEGTAVSPPNYTLVAGDSPSVTFDSVVTDNCGSPLPCSKTCVVQVASGTCVLPTCDYTVTKL